MKIIIDKATVNFEPENDIEKTYLEALWTKVGNCSGDNKKLIPIGTYYPQEQTSAQFFIDGLTESEAKETVVRAPYDTDVYCKFCNRTEHVKKGDEIPVCCGKVMEILD